MKPEYQELYKAALALIVSLTTLGLGWLVTQRITVAWNLRQKQRESDLATAHDFHRLYGEFFAVWKLWNYSLTPNRGCTVSRADLLLRASSAEAGVESLFVRLSAGRQLKADDIRVLGCFRQAYQRLRETITENEKLDWGSSTHPEYLAFKRLATAVALLIVSETSPSRAVAKAQADALIRITSNEWEDNWTQPIAYPSTGTNRRPAPIDISFGNVFIAADVINT